MRGEDCNIAPSARIGFSSDFFGLQIYLNQVDLQAEKVALQSVCGPFLEHANVRHGDQIERLQAAHDARAMHESDADSLVVIAPQSLSDCPLSRAVVGAADFAHAPRRHTLYEADTRGRTLVPDWSAR